jgi:WhiB family redox-sensing transcriptional regulator
MDNLDWHEDAECSKPENSEHINDFFANKASKVNKVLSICEECPVRAECLKWALESKQTWGVWGGLSYKKIRRTLSINWEGQEMRHKRFPLCPYCRAKTSKLVTKTVERPVVGRWATMRVVECLDCNFSWQSRTSANAVDAYHAQQSKK